MSVFVPLERLTNPIFGSLAHPRAAAPEPHPAQARNLPPGAELYCREVALFDFEGHHVLFDVERFRLFVVTAETLRFLDGIGALRPRPWWEPAVVVSGTGDKAVIEFLVENGILTATMPAEPAEARPAPVVPTGLTLHVNHICNLRCVYCYADGGSYGGGPLTMSRNVMERAIDSFLAVCDPRQASIHWFGGEPLLSFNEIRSGTLYAEDRARALCKEISFSVTSNGTTITDEIADFLREHRIGVTVSCDGTPALHDTLRPRADGRGSYADMQAGLRTLERHSVPFGLRATATRDHMDLTEQLIQLGSIAPPDGVDLQFDVHRTQGGQRLSPLEEERLRSEYREIADRLLESRDAVHLQKYVGMREVVQGIISKQRKQRGCRAGTSSYAVHPEGHVFPCHRFVTDERYRLGNVLDGFNFGATPAFDEAIVFNREPCSTCWARYLCGGACYNICSENSDNILTPPAFYCQNMTIKAGEAIRLVWKASQLADRERGRPSDPLAAS